MRFVGKGLLTVLLLGAALALRAAPPAWWEQRGVVNPGATANDYAAANLGQVKQIAKQAALEMEARLPGGAGAEINALVASWSQAPAPGVTRNDYAAVNHGQLKALAKLFYNRLAAVGCTGAPLAPGAIYPWTTDTADDASFAPANLGQVKFLFSFDLYDNDHDGLPDSWERQYLGHLGYGPGDDPYNVGRNLQASYDQNLSPLPAAPVADGLRLWFSADAGVVKNGNDAVTQWVDLSGHGFHVQALAADGPHYAAAALNGHPAVGFAGGQRLDSVLPYDVLGGAGSEITVIAVFKPEANPNPAAVLFSDWDGVFRVRASSGSDYSLVWVDQNGNWIGSGATLASPGVTQVVSYVNGADATIRSYLNGVLQSAHFHGTQGINHEPRVLQVGVQGHVGGFFKGQIAEILVYNRALSDAERQQVEAGFSAKYNLDDADGDGLNDAWEKRNFGTLAYGAGDDPYQVGRTLQQSHDQNLSPLPAPAVADGLRLWFSAEAGVVRNGDEVVTQWNDLSGHGFHVRALASDGPHYAAAALNGHPALGFAGGQRLDSVSQYDLVGDTDTLTVIAVFKPDAEQTPGGVLFSDWDGVFRVRASSGNDYSLVWVDENGNWIGSGATQATPGVTQVVSYVNGADATVRNYLNGVLQSAQAHGTHGINHEPRVLQVGVQGHVSGYFKGQIAEILVYNRALSDTERQQIEAEFSAKYNLDDADGDGLSDAWELRYLGTLQYGAADDPYQVGRTLEESETQALSPLPPAPVGDGLRVWYRADLGVIVDAEQNVTQWRDLSGRGLHVTTDGAPPSRTASAINDLPAVNFAGSHQLVTPRVVDLFGGSNEVTVFAVFRPAVQQDYTSVILAYDWAYFRFQQQGGVTNRYGTSWLSDQGYWGGGGWVGTTGGQPQLVTVVARPNNVSRGYLNGVAQSLDADNTGGFVQDPKVVKLGNAGYGDGFDGQLAELLVYNRALADGERAEVEAALIAKYHLDDVDGDGLPDAWERHYFGTLQHGSADDPYGVGRTLQQSHDLNLSPLPSALVADGLRAWYRADLGVTKDADNKISVWADLSGHGFHAGLGGLQPHHIANAVNGLPVVEFSEGQRLQTPVIDLQDGSSDQSVIMVLQPAAQQTSWGPVPLGLGQWSRIDQAGGLNSFRFQWLNAAHDGWHGDRSLVQTSAARPQVLTFVKAGETQTGWVNGQPQAEEPVSAGMAATPSVMAIAGDVPDAGRYFDGRIAEILVYNRALSAAERQSIEAGLAAKYHLDDTDGDGLPDAWEQQYLGTLHYGAGDDPYGVGRTLQVSHDQELSPLPVPATGAGLRAWYRADLGVSRGNDNRVAQWADLSGHGFHVVQAQPALQPLWLGDSFNDQAAVEFAEGRQLRSILADVQAGSSEQSVFVVLRPVAQPTSWGPVVAAFGTWNRVEQAGGVNRFRFEWLNAAHDGWHGDTSAVQSAAEQPQLLSFVKSGTTQHGWLNGALQSEETVSAEMGVPVSPVAVGSDSSDGGRYFDGRIAEIRVYNRALTPAERQQVETELIAQYGLDDTEGDGLSDGWERQYLGTLQYGPGADPYGVGRTLQQSHDQTLSPLPAAPVAAGLRAWYRAGSGLTKNGDSRVSQWADLSGNGFHVFQSNLDLQPRWLENVLNGEPMVEFAEGRQLRSILADVQAGSSEQSVFVVLRPVAQPTSWGPVVAAFGLWNRVEQAGGVNRLRFEWLNAAHDAWHGDASAVQTVAGRPQILSFVKAGTTQGGWLNGALQAEETVSAEMGVPVSAVALGSDSSDGGRYFDGRLAEILVYNRAVTPAEREAIEAALTAKYIEPDTDADGLGDNWENRHFGTLAHGATDDPGSVGRTLLESYEQNLSPWPAPVVSQGLRAWYRADLGVTKDVDNRVSGWTDLSGHGVHVVQPAANRQPHWTAGALNGHATVTFAPDLMALQSPEPKDVFAGSDNLSVVVVLKPSAQQESDNTLLAFGNDAFLVAQGQTGAVNRYEAVWRNPDDNSYGNGGSTSVTAARPQILTVVKNGRSIESYLGDVLQRRDTPGWIPSAALQQGAFLVTLGARSHQYHGYQGEIAEVLVYNRVLSATERAQISAALTADYVNPDEDNDGLADAWEDRTLGTRTHGPTEDPGAVGRTLLESFQQELSPWPAPVVNSGLRAWYRADLGIVKDGNNEVSRWSDLTGHGFHVDQDNPARRPQWEATGPGGQPALNYTTAGSALQTSRPVDAFAGGHDLTVFVALKPATGQREGSTLVDIGEAYYRLWQSGATNQYGVLWYDAPDNTYGSGEPVTLEGEQTTVITMTKTGNNVKGHLNGTLQNDFTAGWVAPAAPLVQEAGFLTLGAMGSQLGQFTGRIAEVLVYNRALTAEERAQVEAALRDRYIQADEDGDGLADAWERQHFGTIGFGGSDDPGAVGRPLLESYQQNLSPWPAPIVAGGLRAWYRADLGVAKGGDGKVVRWTDLSGHSVHVSQVNPAKRPQWEENPFNGQPALSFTQELTALQTPYVVDAFGGSNDITVVTVLAPTAEQTANSTLLDIGAASYRLTQADGGPANRYRALWYNEAGSTYGEGGHANLIPGATQVHVVTKAAKNVKTWIDGALRGDSTPAWVPDETLRQGPGLVTVGAMGNQLAGYQGRIAEMLVYNRALTAGERQEIETALKAKYFNPDGDGDGLPDAWEKRHFGTLGFGAGDDPGGVGRTVLESFQQELNPWPAPVVGGGLRAWYRADRGVVKDPDNKVTQWTDVSGQGFHLGVAHPGYRPSYQAAAVNGLPALAFADSSVLTTEIVDLQAASTDLSVVVVMMPAATQTENAPLVDFNQGGAGGFAVYKRGFTDNYVMEWTVSPDNWSGYQHQLPVAANAAHVVSFIKNGTSLANYRDGEPGAGGTVEAGMITPTTTLSVGGHGNWLGYEYFTGRIAEVLIYNRALSAEERAQVEAVLTEKYLHHAQKLAAGGDQSLLLHFNHGASAWGRNALGQLADGTRTDRAQVLSLTALPRALASAAYGENHGLAVTFDGLVQGWGDNYFGQLGAGDATGRTTPAILDGLGWVKQAAAGDHHSLALLADGTVWSWGGNQSGQLGDGTTVGRSTPAQVPGLAHIVAVTAGAAHSAALAADGTVWVWGDNEFGQMGDDVSAHQASPVAMPTLTGVVALVSGRHHFLALKADGSVLAWGANQSGQLGLGDSVSRFVPEAVAGLPAIKALAAGTSHSVALATDGTVWSWGANVSGQLGNGTTDPASVPAASGLADVTGIASGRDHVLALKSDGAVWAWGDNTHGQLGSGTTDAFSATPIFVYADE